MIRITSKIDGFRRAGVAHSGKPTDYPNDYFTAYELSVLEAEPYLIVQQLPDPKVADDDGKPGAKKAGK